MKGKVQALRRGSKAAPAWRGGLGPGTFNSTLPRFCSRRRTRGRMQRFTQGEVIRRQPSMLPAARLVI